MATTALRREIEFVSPTRQWVMGIVFLALGFSIWFFFSRSVPSRCRHNFWTDPWRIST
jgi:hypothetical protein